MSVLSLAPEDKRKDQRNSLESVYSSNSRLNLLQKRKRMNPLRLALGMSTQQQQQQQFVTQRVLSAKTHRVKQLQNQLADAHYHLQELTNENKILRALQKKQEIALQRYENSNAELPQVLNSHNEEMRVQQIKYKQARQQLRDLEARLRERDQQLQALRDEHRHLLDLTRDRNLLEREKLQAQVLELKATVQRQQETIGTLQRRVTLEAKNFKHQLQLEINKHKDTRHDLDLAISNADKLSTIIEMKEKMMSTAAGRSAGVRSPTKVASLGQLSRSLSKAAVLTDDHTADHKILSKLCESSRTISSALSQDDDAGSLAETRSRRVPSSRATPSRAQKTKGSDIVLELAKTVQDGIADLTVNDDRPPSDMFEEDPQKKSINAMKIDLMNKIKNNEEPILRNSSALSTKFSEDTIEEQIVEDVERPKSRGRRHSTVSFYGSVHTEEISGSVVGHGTGSEVEKHKINHEGDIIERKLSGKSVNKYCKELFEDIEKSSRAIDGHVKQLSAAQNVGSRLAGQLRVADSAHELLNASGDLPTYELARLQDDFKMLSQRVLSDDHLTNQDLLDDLLGKK